MKKVILLFASCMALSTASFASPSRWVDGNVHVAVAEVNGKICFTEAEKNTAIAYVQNAGTEPLTVNDFNDSFFVSVATSGIKFENNSDYLDAIANKDKLQDKLDDMKPSDRKKNKKTIDYLEIENSKR